MIGAQLILLLGLIIQYGLESLDPSSYLHRDLLSTWVINKLTDYSYEPSPKIRALGYLLAVSITLSSLTIISRGFCFLFGSYKASHIWILAIAIIILITAFRYIFVMSEKAKLQPLEEPCRPINHERIFIDRG